MRVDQFEKGHTSVETAAAFLGVAIVSPAARTSASRFGALASVCFERNDIVLLHVQQNGIILPVMNMKL